LWLFQITLIGKKLLLTTDPQPNFSQLFKQLRNIAHNHRWLGLVSALIVAFIGLTVLFLVPTKFQANARIYVDTQTILTPLLKELAVPANEEQEINRLAKLLITRPNLEKVMFSADLAVSKGSIEGREKLIEQMLKDVEFKQTVGSPGVFHFSYRHENPETAKRVVQLLVNLFLETSLRLRRENVDVATRFVDEQIRSMEQRLKESEELLKEFKIRNQGQLPNQTGDYFSQLATLESQLRQARLDLLQFKSSRDALQLQIQKQEDSDAVKSAALAVNQARQLVGDLSRRYTSVHPDLIQANKSLADAQIEFERIKAESRSSGLRDSAGTTSRLNNPPRVAAGKTSLTLALAEFESQIASTKVKLTDLEARLAQFRLQGTQMPRVETELAQLARDYDTNRQQFERLLTKRESLRLTSQISGANGGLNYQLLDPAYVLQNPVSPNRLLLILAISLASVAAAVLAIVLKHRYQPKFYDLTELRQTLGFPMLGGVSLVQGSQLQTTQRLSAIAFYVMTAALISILLSLTFYQSYLALNK
jgi:polysaccharide chain length determinant protein (PEP-CTERM system associated)